MTDEKPTIPPWLVRTGDDNYSTTSHIWQMLDRGEDGHGPLSHWLRWRSELAAALGLVEPARARPVDLGDPLALYNQLMAEQQAERAPFIAKAVAAELRAQADAIETGNEAHRYEWQRAETGPGAYEAAARLRARADELDPVNPEVADE